MVKKLAEEVRLNLRTNYSKRDDGEGKRDKHSGKTNQFYSNCIKTN